MNDMASIRKTRPLPGAPWGNSGATGAGVVAAWAEGASVTAVAVSSCEFGFLRGKKIVYQRSSVWRGRPRRWQVAQVRALLLGANLGHASLLPYRTDV